MKKLVINILIAAVLVLSLTACGGDSGTNAAAENATAVSTGSSATDSTITTVSSAPMLNPGYTDNDLATTWDKAAAVEVTLNGDSISMSGSGAAADGSTLTITSAGTYVLSGTLTDGQIVVETIGSDKVWLVLNGVSLSCSTSPAIYVKQADKVFLMLAEGSENVVTDGSAYTLADGEDEPNAAIFSKDDLTVGGAGSLTVTANYRHGIVSKDDLVITGGTITVNAAEDGIRGRDCTAICGGIITVNAVGDGIKSNNDTDSALGWVSIDGGTISITAGEDGIQAESVLQITDGDLTILTGGGSNSAAASLGNTGFGWGNSQGAEDTNGESAKGIKAGISLYITGGALDIDALDDSVHSNGTAAISGGTCTLASGDDSVHAEGELLVSGGTVNIINSYEGLEGMPIIITGGETRLIASDDGINAAGDDDSAAIGSVAGPMSAASTSEDCYIQIAGGLVVIDAGGDGIDSNGNVYMEGGTVLVSGPTDSANGALDVEGSAQITGGTLVAAGSAGMGMNFGDTSTQASLMVNYSSVQPGGTLLTLLDENEGVIVSFAPFKDYQSVVISTPDMEQNGTYTLCTGGSTETASGDGLYTGSYTPGTEVVSITIDSIITSISETGAAVSNGMGGGMGGNGGPQQGNGAQRGPDGTQEPGRDKSSASAAS